jgi:hypothetical protein
MSRTAQIASSHCAVDDASTAPRNGTLIWLHCHSEAEPVIGCWSRAFIGWVSYTEDVPLIRQSAA